MPKLERFSILLIASVGCATDPSPEATGEVAQQVCTPRPPIDPAMCNPEEPIAPPPINGQCTVELRVTKVGFFTGQGWFENRAEANASFTATNLDNPNQHSSGSYPGVGTTIKMEIDTEHNVSIPLGSYVVAANDPDGVPVQVCGTFTEKDGGFNGDDIGFRCETIRLQCPQAEANRPIRADLCKGGDCTKKRGMMTANINVSTADADGDCIPNEPDWTDQPCDEAFKGQLCRASLVYFHQGPGDTNQLVSYLGTDLAPALSGYDHTVLLIDDNQIGPYNVNVGAAEVRMPPTEESFFAAMQDLTSQGCDMDIWIFAQGLPSWAVQPDNSVLLDGGRITAFADDDLTADPDITTTELLEATDPAVSGTPSIPVRMTYGTPSHYREWNIPWVLIGAKATSGALDLQFTPNFYENFVASWNANRTYEQAWLDDFDLAMQDVAFSFVDAQAVAVLGCSILGKSNCAEDFFIDSDALPAVDVNGELIDGPDYVGYPIGGPLANRVGLSYLRDQTGELNMQAASILEPQGSGFSTVTKSSTGLSWK